MLPLAAATEATANATHVLQPRWPAMRFLPLYTLFQILKRLPARPAVLAGLVHGAAATLATKGLRVNCLAPGFTESPETASMPMAQKLAAITPMKRCAAAAGSICSICNFERCLTGNSWCGRNGGKELAVCEAPRKQTTVPRCSASADTAHAADLRSRRRLPGRLLL